MTTRHSLKILNQLREYDSFLDSLKTIADMGCGTGEDIEWWATLMTRDDPPKPYNYKCFAVDRDDSKLSQVPNLSNIH
jgi:ubiquinone/menaquinone biosynthesis C-methylase UbiE